MRLNPKRLIPWLAASALLLAPAALADTPAYALVKDKSSLKFVAIQNGAPVEGAFNNFTADIHFDPDKLDESSIIVTVDTASVASPSDEVMQYIKLPDWLSAEAFPKAVFKSKKLSRMPQSDNYYASGDLTIRDKTLPVMLNFQMERFDGKHAIAKGYITVRRIDFGVGQGEWSRDDVIKNEVRVEFRVVADKQ